MRSPLRKLTAWFTLDMAVFLALNIFLLSKIRAQVDSWPNLTFLKLLILGLASYRSANIISNESVTEPLRAPFVTEKLEHGHIVETPKKSGFLGAFGHLIYCPSCTGVWLAAILTYSYIFWPTPTLIVALLLSLSAIERIVSRTMEYLKLKK
jgi:hypothetical protein